MCIYIYSVPNKIITVFTTIIAVESFFIYVVYNICTGTMPQASLFCVCSCHVVAGHFITSKQFSVLHTLYLTTQTDFKQNIIH